MKADKQVGGFAFLHGVGNAAHYIDRPSAARHEAHIGRSGNFCGVFQLFETFAPCVGVVLKHYVEGRERRVGARSAEHKACRHEIGNGFGIGE